MSKLEDYKNNEKEKAVMNSIQEEFDMNSTPRQTKMGKHHHKHKKQSSFHLKTLKARIQHKYKEKVNSPSKLQTLKLQVQDYFRSSEVTI